MRLHLVLLLALGLSACSSPQRIAGPLWLPGDPGEGPRTDGRPVASVLRHSGPVLVVRPGAPAGYQLSYQDKRARLLAGARVGVGPGGRAELLWEGEPSSIVLFGQCIAEVGDPGRDQPALSLLSVLRAQLRLTAEDRVALPGGALLRAEVPQGLAPGVAGPIVVENRQQGQIVRVHNQGKSMCLVRYREAELMIAPGDAVDLPVLSAGSAPVEPDAEATVTRVAGLTLHTSGAVAPAEDGGRVRLSLAGGGTGRGRRSARLAGRGRGGRALHAGRPRCRAVSPERAPLRGRTP